MSKIRNQEAKCAISGVYLTLTYQQANFRGCSKIPRTEDQPTRTTRPWSWLARSGLRHWERGERSSSAATPGPHLSSRISCPIGTKCAGPAVSVSTLSSRRLELGTSSKILSPPRRSQIEGLMRRKKETFRKIKAVKAYLSRVLRIRYWVLSIWGGSSNPK